MLTLRNGCFSRSIYSVLMILLRLESFLSAEGLELLSLSLVLTFELCDFFLLSLLR